MEPLLAPVLRSRNLSGLDGNQKKKKKSTYSSRQIGNLPERDRLVLNSQAKVVNFSLSPWGVSSQLIPESMVKLEKIEELYEIDRKCKFERHDSKMKKAVYARSY